MIEQNKSIHSPSEKKNKAISNLNVDTVIVPARPDGVQKVFLGENRWYQIRISASMLSQIQYIAVYQTAPISAVTHLAKVASIEPWGERGKWVVNFSEPAEEIKHVTLSRGGKIRPLQSGRYARRDELLRARTLDDVWG